MYSFNSFYINCEYETGYKFRSQILKIVISLSRWEEKCNIQEKADFEETEEITLFLLMCLFVCLLGKLFRQKKNEAHTKLTQAIRGRLVRITHEGQ
jgi:hypothetical protein